MRAASFGFMILGWASAGCGMAILAGQPEKRDRSPVDLVVSPESDWLATANQTSHSVSLVRIADGRVLDEIAIGERPTAIALHPDGKRLLVTASYAGELHVLEVADEQLTRVATLTLGDQPYGIAVSPDGRQAYVALLDADRIAVVDLPRYRVIGAVKVGRWPRSLALSADGKRLAVATSGDRGISLVDLETEQMVHIDRFVGLNIGQLAMSAKGEQLYFPWMVYRRNPITERNIRLGWVMASRLGRIGWEDSAHREAISLDPPGRAVADPHGLAVTSDESQVIISASGTHELLFLQVAGLPFQGQGSTDHIDPELLRDEQRFFRLPLGGRPMGVRLAKDDRTIYVANYLRNSVQVVDRLERRLQAEFELGGAEVPSLERRGEAIFYDAARSLDQWYSCHSCHYEGGTNAVTMDTFNDGTAFTFKTVLPLYRLDQSAPWTWHGWQTELPSALRHSLTTTMLGPEPTDAEVQALQAYLSSLPPPPPRGDTARQAAVERGKVVFFGERAGCSQCHRGAEYTDGEIHDLALGKPDDKYTGFNTPSLIGVFRKNLLLHDGRHTTLRELLRGQHAPEVVSGTTLSDQEFEDLIAFLESL